MNVPGFPGFEPGDPLPASLVDELEGRALTQPLRVVAEPGKSPRYSGGGYALLQLMLTDVRKRPFAETMRREVLIPAGMTSSTFAHTRTVGGVTEEGDAIPPGGWIYPEQAAAGLTTTARDLARFVIALQTDELLSHEATQRMLGVFVIRKGRYFAHPGGNAGYYALFVASRTKPEGVAILTNSELGDRLADEIVRGVAREYGWEGYLPEPKKLVAVDVKPFAGRYRVDADDVLTVRAEGDHLMAERTAGKPFRLDAISASEFTRRDEDEQYAFTADAVAFGETTAKRDEAKIAYELPIGEALAAYRALNLDEEQLRARGIARKSVELLALNTELHSKSAAAWDALATAQLAAGDEKAARRSSQQVLDVL
ncbi:MAG TPA: serine hydrolase domain-containing protein, partial [Thermoanaerobaculia bacterium]|nr:serine hydrolase domain-containing protein [Thermoanaerobaculia bacterium]